MFELDKLIINSVKSLMSNMYLQASFLTGLWVISEIVFPSKKVKK